MPKLTKKVILAKLEQNTDLLRSYSVKRIGLFGSYKKGKQKETSDIDLLVKLGNPTFDNYMDLKFDLEKVLKKKKRFGNGGSCEA